MFLSSCSSFDFIPTPQVSQHYPLAASSAKVSGRFETNEDELSDFKRVLKGDQLEPPQRLASAATNRSGGDPPQIPRPN
jgi:hypothetical protein